jgi:asparaginyl-tRNA synthetase
LGKALRKNLTITDPSTLIEGLGTKERKAVFDIQTEILEVMTHELVRRGFTWILPVVLAKSTDPLWPDPGASIEKRIEVEIYGETVRTMQSMILHKRVLASLGPEKFFVLSPNIRIEARERAETGWHLYEFTQLDIEVAHAQMKDMFRLFEDLMKNAIVAAKQKFADELKILGRNLATPETPFKVHKKNELVEKFGNKWEEKLSEESENPVWVTDLPREFYDFQDDTGIWHNFDLLLPEGYGELISGAEREYEYTKINKKLERDGLNKADYEILLKLAREGRLKPSAGAGLGLERFVGYISGVRHVAEVQPFPRIPGIVPDL